MLVYKVKTAKVLHAQECAKLVADLSQFNFKIDLKYKDYVIDAKSILGLISLALKENEQIKIIANTGRESFEKLTEVLSKYVHTMDKRYGLLRYNEDKDFYEFVDVYETKEQAEANIQDAYDIIEEYN